MKILTIADEESKYYWDFFEKSKLEGIDMILSAGDLAPQYLEFLATYSKAPIIYVHGNHDKCYDDTPPLGCICADDTIVTHNGIRILGLGGSMKYSGGNYQYTEGEMRMRYMKLMPKIIINRGFDILLTHSPAKGLNDGQDLPHQGFECFNFLMDRYKPKYFIHGHVHLNYDRKLKRETMYNGTKVVNAYIKHIIDYDGGDDVSPIDEKVETSGTENLKVIDFESRKE